MMRNRIAKLPLRYLLVLCLALNAQGGRAATGPAAADWKAGVASVVITPDENMWMAGYAARTKPADGKINDLRAKALALEDASGTRLVIVTLDLLAVPRELRDWMEVETAGRYKLPPESLLLNASHTHSGPELRPAKLELYGLGPDRIQQAERYNKVLKEKLSALVGRALSGLSPARLVYSKDSADFAMNRRLRTKTGYSNNPNPDGPTDHDVPLLQVRSDDGKLQAVLFGYACHNTTLSDYEYCGDYAGFAQEYVEEAHPGVTAMFSIGCAGDQNPYPRRKLELARQHGKSLAEAVERALQAEARGVHGPLRAAIEDVTLEFAPPPSKAELEKRAQSPKNQAEQRHAAVLLKQLAENGTIRTTYPCKVQTIRFGNDLTLVAIAGEVVVDYSLRLKRELTETPLWVMGYANDVFGYLPSVRVLKEGGYEGGEAMNGTSFPGPFAPTVEERVVGEVHKLNERVAKSSRP